MKMFLATLIISIIVITLFGLLINFCRKRLANTKHGLSGMCHRHGGEICSSCGEEANNRQEKKEITGRS